MESLLFKNSKHKKDILFIFTNRLLLNNKIYKRIYEIYEQKYSIYNYSDNDYRSFVSTCIKLKIFGIRLVYYNRNKSSFIAIKYIQE
jgi:hypothetical protein